MPDSYASLRAHFENVAGVSVSAGRGAQGLKVGKKMFAMFYKGDLLLTLPSTRVAALIDSGRGLPFDPGTGTVMKNRVLIPAGRRRSWVKLCEEAAGVAGGGEVKGPSKKQSGGTTGMANRARKSSKPKLLSGGNPQIAKADGDAPVQAYVDAMPDWKRDVGRRLDALVTRTVPGVRRAVRWNSPFYGMDGRGWFLSFHCFAKYVKVTFLNGASLRPQPPVESKVPNTRYFHIHEGEVLDDRQWASWLKQASKLDGDHLF
ncbi:MAG: DUF1801 domain-containing protein [Myxococcales bacterium]|nr:DUF1801 domain-containing protein [Myxococcales bacterium]